ncbi:MULTISPECIES: ABC transporter substrate-binding protein [Paenibacillus]|uniref:ABC transporter substrate-binding protein n=1 Tax=Paenibacillus TaxID=44249 RepID=UPI0022B86879|nr:sugar ABC transporter substrate-binding protein [Paenibacillus caseinilyticus]MCZ8518581.1 sugar ABC transporter substrate-binding protein [Paenibacillus caseinilyticus]
MKKAHGLMLATTLLLGSLATACSSGGGDAAKPDANAGSAAAGGKTKLQFWTFNELHQKYFVSMADAWNKAHPDKAIQLEASTLPFDDMHNKLLVALQSGTGAPDISDIEISKFPNYLKGTPQLAELNKVVEPELKNIVKSRVDIYSKDGKYYGIDYHVGASVIYYNKEMLDKAGVNPDSITTWDEFYEAGKKVVAATGKPMITFEATDPFSFWPMIAQQGSDITDKDGKVILDNEKNIATLTFMQKLVKEKIAIVAPGGFHHAEEYYGFMNKAGAASVAMPMWYMGRFTDYMPDLKGKLVIKPMPAWTKGGNRSVGMGGTGTAVTAQSKNKDLAVEFLAFAKLSKEANIQIWKQLGFDPIRTEVWDSPELKEDNKFTQYFGKDIFSVLIDIKNEIGPVNINEKMPEVNDELKKTTLFKVLNDMEDPAATLKASAEQLRK